MRSLRSISKPVATRTLAGILLFATGHGWAPAAFAQTISDGDRFTPYHEALNQAVDRVLVAPAQPPVPAPQTSLASFAAPIEAAERKVGGSAAAFNRVRHLRPIIEPILREEQVPTDLAAIVLVESAGQPNALSPKGARGLWQFMPDTARRYGLIVTPQRDERLDIGRSTRAAARYLRVLYRQFGDWQLAFAAYNAGEERLQHAIDRNGTRDFSKLSSARSIPLETVKYVPAVVDATRMFTANGAVFSLRNGGSSTWRVYADSRPSREK